MRIPLVATLLLVACGGSSATPDAAVDGFTDHDAAPTFGARMPVAIAADPTDIMAAPKGMAIAWDNDPNLTSIETFFDSYGKSTAWSDATAEYGIGALTNTVTQSAGSAAPATVTEADLLGLLTTNLTAARWGVPDPSTLYMFFIPVGTKVDDGTGSFTCTDYDGYHFDTMINGVDTAYAISASCHGEATQLGISDLDDLMITAGHEAIEAVTDPRTAFVDKLGWGEVDDAHSAFEYVTEGELADLCEYASTEDWIAPPSLAYSVQRSWSNKAAAAGHDPCVGEAQTTYYQTIPDDPDPGIVNFAGRDQHTLGTKIAVGATGSIRLQVYSDTPGAGPFKVEAFDLDGVLTFPTQPTGAFMPGDQLTIPVSVDKKSGRIAGGEVYEIDTTPVSGGGPKTTWYAYVVQ